MAKRTPIHLSNRLPKRKKARPLTRLVAKVGRNEPCPCGSGQKYKDCHEASGEDFLVKLAMQRGESQAEGTRTSWFRRLFGGS